MILVDLGNLLLIKKVEFGMKALLSLASHIWYYIVFEKRMFICLKRDSNHNYMKDSLVSLKKECCFALTCLEHVFLQFGMSEIGSFALTRYAYLL